MGSVRVAMRRVGQTCRPWPIRTRAASLRVLSLHSMLIENQAFYVLIRDFPAELLFEAVQF